MVSFCVLAIGSSDSGSVTPSAPFAISAYRRLRSGCSGSVNGTIAGPSLVDRVAPVRVEYCDWVAEYAVETLSPISGSGTLSSVDDFDFAGRPRLGLVGAGGGCVEIDGCVSGSGEPTATRLRGFIGRRSRP